MDAFDGICVAGGYSVLHGRTTRRSGEPVQLVLSGPEADLVAHAEGGATLDLAGAGAASVTAMRSWGSTRAVRAEVIRCLLLGRLGAPLDPHGVRIRGARIIGALDLENVESKIELSLTACVVEGGIVLRDASLGSLAFDDCVIDSDQDAVALDARRLVASTLLVSGATLHTRGTACPLALNGARIQHRLDLSGAYLDGQDANGVSLFGDGLVVGGGLYARMRNDQSFRSRGAIRFPGAVITGQFDLSGAHLAGHDSDGDSLIAERLKVEGDAVLAAEIDQSQRFRTAGAVSMPGAYVTGELNLSGAELGRNATGVSLRADNLTVGSGARFAALAAHRFTAHGAINLSGASVAGLLDLTRADIIGYDDRGVSLIGDRLTVTGSALLRGDREQPFAAAGQLRLLGAHISRVLDMSGSLLAGGDFATDPSLWCDRITVEGDLDLGLRGDLAASSQRGVSLRAAKVGGRLTARLADMGTAGCNSTLVLRNASLGEFCLNPDLGNRANVIVDLDGATYQGLPAGDTQKWLDLLRNNTVGYAPQPYQQLAAAHRAVGNKREATRTSIAQQEDRRTRHLRAPDGAHLWTRIRLFTRRRGLAFQRITIGYGYRTWPTFAAVFALTLLGAGLGLAAGQTRAHPATHMVAYRKPAAATEPPSACSTVEQLGVGVHIPFLTDIAAGDCTLDTTTMAGEGYATAIWCTDVLMWAAASLAVAGYTGLVRQS